MSASRGREIAGRALLAAGGVLAALLLLEGVLRLGAFLVHFIPSRVAGNAPETSGLRLLALGDSNTWGLWVKASEAYPEQIEFLWNAAGNRPGLEVFNLGYPGMNSTAVRKRLPQLLRMFRPDIVTVMIGINDYWTAPEEVGEADLWTRIDMHLWLWSRLYRAAAMIRRGIAVPKIDAPRDAFSRPTKPLAVEAGGERLEMPKYQIESAPGWVDRLAANLDAIAGIVRASGATVVFLTYPAGLPLSPAYGVTNSALREAADRLGVPLIEVTPWIATRCRELPCKDITKDNHPTQRGHRRAARVVVEALATLLEGAAKVPAPPWSP